MEKDMRDLQHQAESPEAREIAEHLDIAAKKMVDDIAAHQRRVVHYSAKALKDFTEWVEPGNDCDSKEFASCLHAETRTFTSTPPTEAFVGKCAQESKCNLNFDQRVRTHKLEKGAEKAEKAERAMRRMAHDIEKDVWGEMRDQGKNVLAI